MADRSKIEWTDASWSPIRARWFAPQNDGGGKERVGWHCEHVSEGCRNCYSESMNLRLGTGLLFKPDHRRREIRVPPGDPYGTREMRGDVTIFLDEKMLLQPLRWRRPRKVFVCSMTDLFADFVTDEMIDRVFAVMALCPRHTFQVLTKRPERMRAYVPSANARAATAAMEAAPTNYCIKASNLMFAPGRNPDSFFDVWPLPNVWLGCSTEDQATADQRIPHLLATPAVVRFVSAEPLLGPIDFTSIDLPGGWREVWPLGQKHLGRDDVDDDGNPLPRLDWIIVGGESGHHARPMHPRWATDIRDQCAAAGVPFHHKQNGMWRRHYPQAGGDLGGDVRRGRVQLVHLAEHTDADLCKRSFFPGDIYMERLRSKEEAGRLLDGVTHDGFPEIRL